MVKHYRPRVVAEAKRHLSTEWARIQLTAHNFRPKAKTTTRIVTADAIVRAAEAFYKECAEAKCAPELTFNMDEFFCLFGEENNRWTWTPKTDQCVPVSESKLGFTASILTSADGAVHLLQIIWKGKTSAVHSPCAHPKILQCHRRESHFQSSATFEVWQRKFIEIVEARRAALGKPADERAVLIYDAAPQHVLMRDLDMANISTIQVPKKMTHINSFA